MIPGFEEFDVDVPWADGTVRIHGSKGGAGPPLLLLHGFPQNHRMWHRAAPRLAETHTVVAADLRGYGSSGQVADTEDHAAYSFRAMAADQVAVMNHFGFDRFAVVGHDRGARVTHRMALDHPGAVERLAVLDIMPTAYVYSHVTRLLATVYYHWFFFIQPFDLPERLISADPEWYIRRLLGGWGSGLDSHDPEALASYIASFSDPEVRHAMLEDYRAGASIDLVHDAASAEAGVQIVAPTLVLFGQRGAVALSDDHPVSVWQERATSPGLVTGKPIPGAGHFLLEEGFDDTLAALEEFLARPAQP